MCGMARGSLGCSARDLRCALCIKGMNKGPKSCICWLCISLVSRVFVPSSRSSRPGHHAGGRHPRSIRRRSDWVPTAVVALPPADHPIRPGVLHHHVRLPHERRRSAASGTPPPSIPFLPCHLHSSLLELSTNISQKKLSAGGKGTGGF
jgi:hypothetical protein